MSKVNQRLIPLLLLAVLIVVSVFVLGPDRDDRPTDENSNTTPSLTGDADLETAELDGAADIPVPDPDLKFEAAVVERSELADAALVVEVVVDEGGTAAPIFDLFLVDYDEQIIALSDRTGQVGLANTDQIEYLCARGEHGWSTMQRIADAEDVDGIPHLKVVLDQARLGFTVSTSTLEGLSTSKAKMSLSAENGVAFSLLTSSLGNTDYAAEADGGFRVDGLPPALFQANFKLDDHVPARLTIDLDAQDQHDLEVVFQPAGAATGRVVFADAGIPEATVALLPADFQDNIFGLALDNFRSAGQIPDLIPAHHQVITDADGSFRLGTVEPGEYQVMVAAPNYLPLITTDSITVPARDSSTCGDIEVELGFGLNLLVVDMIAKPVNDVSVSWYRKAGSSLVEARRRRTVQQQQTSQGGRLHIGGLPPEQIVLEFNHPDFAQVVIEHDFSGRTEKANDDLEVVLQVGATAEGSVVDGRTGMPIESANLELHTAENNQAFGALLRGSDWDALSGKDGHFMFSHLPSGEYVLIAKHDDFAETTKGPFDVTDSAVENLTVIMHPGSVLVVTVLDSEGVGIPEATVQAVNVVAQQVKTGTTDDQGVARLENITPGGYQVSFTDISSFDTSSNQGNLDVSFKFLQIEDGEELEITLGGPVLSADVEGVVRLGGELVKSATVAIITDSGMKVDTTDEVGAFTVEDVPLGTFIIVARAGLPGAGGSVFYDNINVANEGIVHHDVDMPNDGVKVSVFNSADRQPMASIPVSVRPMDATNISGGDFGITDADGIAEFPSLPAGEYIIAAGNATASFMATSEAGFGARQKSHVIITEGAGVQTIEMPLELGATFKVQVTDPDGNLLAGAHMHYLDSEGQALNILSFSGTNAKGVAQMKGLPSGPGIILVRHPILGSTEIEVNLPAGGEAKQKVQLERGTVIYVTTTDSDGQPISGVLAAALDERGAPLSYLWSQEETQATNAAFFGLGEQKLGPLPDGQYVIQLYRPGNPPVRHQVSVNGHREMHLSLPYSTE